MKALLCNDYGVQVRQCKGCGLLFMPQASEERCALCAPKQRNRPIDLFAEWSERG